MIELRRKKLKPIQTGNLCKMNHNYRQQIMGYQDYIDNGNTDEMPNNYMKKLHVADVDYFYVVNDSPFNSKKLLELIPVQFLHDHNYRPKSFELALKKRMKVLMSRESFFVIQNPKLDIDNINILENRMVMIAKKLKINLEPWRKYLENK